MFFALDLSPMLILLLLVYGLLIAFSLFAWSALNLRQRARNAQQSEQSGSQAEKQAGRAPQPERREPARQQRHVAARQDTPSVRPAPEVQVRVRGTSEGPAPQQKPWLRTPDGQDAQPDVVSLRKPAAPREPATVYVHPEQLPVTRLARPEPLPVRQEPAETGPARQEPAKQESVMPARTQDVPARQETRQQEARPAPEAPAGRKPNEDAFERFLRSSRNDPED